MEETGVGIIQFLVEYPVLIAILCGVNTIMMIALWRDSIRTRESLTQRLSEHEIECAERWGRVESKLEAIDRRDCK